jgi:hypothetical protein
MGGSAPSVAPKLAGLMAVAAVWLVMPGAAGAQTVIPPGLDLFETEPNNTTATFEAALGTGIPPGFLGRDAGSAGIEGGCSGFEGTVHFGGVPLDPRQHGDADTVVQRTASATLRPIVGRTASAALDPMVMVPVRIVELSLRSMEPIGVECGGETQLWQVDLGLSQDQPEGQMSIHQTSPNGGTFDSNLPVVPKFTFTKIGDPTDVRVLDAKNLGPLVLNGLVFNAQNVPWRAGCQPPALLIPGVNDLFCPGLTPNGQKVLTIEQALFARHGIFPVQPSLEHFQCYKLEKKKFKKRRVTLNDQFKNTRAQVKTRKDLCNPAKKNKEPFLNKRAHLTRYAIDGKSINTTVATRNQFGSQRLLVKKPKLLMVPTEKQERGDKRKPIQTQTDHFQCYSVETQTGIRSVNGKPKRVTLKDQFRKKGVKVKGPKLLCAPVDKNQEGLLHPVRHLLCYAIKAKKLRKRVTIRNQFENKGVRVKKPTELCVPTLKTVL